MARKGRRTGMSAAIETDELTKDYKVGFWRPRPYRALDRLTLAVEPGEVFGFLGPNGAGKTTTLKLLMQLVFPTSGRAAILGQPVGDLEVRRRIGYLPENPYFYDNLTAEEVLTYFASLFGYAPADCRARGGRLLDEVGLGAERRLQLRKYSKGMIQRVGIAQALINDPDVIFLYVPMSGLPPLGRRDDLLQLAHPVGCRIALQSRGDRRRRTAGHRRPPAGHGRRGDSRLGNRDDGRAREPARDPRQQGHQGHFGRGRPVHVRASGRCAA